MLDLLVTRKVFSDYTENAVSRFVMALGTEEVQELEIGEVLVGREVLRTVMPIILLLFFFFFYLSLLVRQERPRVDSEVRRQYHHREVVW